MKKFLKVLKYLFIGLGVIVLEQLPILFVAKHQPMWQTLLICLALLLVTGFVMYLAKRLNLLTGPSVLRNGRAWKTVMIGVVILYLVKMLGGAVLFLEHGANANTSNQSVIESLGMPPVLLVVLTVIVAPIVEEIACRGIIQGLAFGNSYLGVAVSTLVFGVLHMPTDIGSWIIYGGMGLVLGLVYHKTQKIEYGITVHFINNALGVALMLLMG